MTSLVTVLVSGAVGAAISWWVRGNELHDTELGQRIDDAVDELVAIENLATELWSRFSSTSVLEKENWNDFYTANIESFFIMEGRLHRLVRLIEFCGENIKNFEDYGSRSIVTNLRIACTSDGLENADLDVNPILRIKHILHICTDLLLCLRRLRRDVLPSEGVRHWVSLFRVNRAFAAYTESELGSPKR